MRIKSYERDSENFLSNIVNLEKDEAVTRLAHYLLHMASDMLFVDISELDAESNPFSEVILGNWGMDSLLASKMRHQVMTDTSADLPLQMLIGRPAGQIVDEIYQQLLLLSVTASETVTDESECEQFVL